MSILEKAFALTLLTALPIAGYSNCPGTETWTGLTNGNWNLATNWSPNTCVPGSVNTDTDVVIFPTTTAGGFTVSLDTGTPISPGLGSLTFNSSTTSYTIQSGTNTDLLTFNGNSQLQVLAGNHSITARMSHVTGPLNITISDPAGMLTITNGIVEFNNSDMVFTGPGQLTFQWGGIPSNSVYIANNLTVNSGTLLNINNIPLFGTDGSEIFANDGVTISGGTVTTLNTADTNGFVGSIIDMSNQLTLNNGTLNIQNSGTVISGGIGSFVGANNLLMTGGSLFITNTGQVTGTGIGCLLRLFQDAQINGGIFINDVVVRAATVNIGPAGTMGGIGTFQAFSGSATTQITNGGTLIAGGRAIGSSSGSMFIQGSYTQTSGGLLVVNLEDTPSLPLLNVTGTAQLAGSLGLAVSDGDSVSGGEVYQIVSANGGISGQFANIINFDSNLMFHLEYFPNYVLLSIIMGSGTSYINYLENLFSSVNHINVRLDRQMAQLRGRFSRPHVEFASVAALSETQDLLVDNSPGIAANPQIEEKQEQLKERMYEGDRPWSFYFGPTGDVGRVLSKKQAIGFHYDSVGALAGFDYAFSDLGVGFLFDYDHIHGRGVHHWGKFNIDQVHGSLYGTYIRKAEQQLAFNLILGGGYEWYTVHRNVGTGSTSGTPQGVEFDALAGMEYTFEKKEFQGMPEHLQVVPLINLQYIYLHVNNYQEHGAGRFNFNYKSQNARSLRSTLGMRMNYSWHGTDVVFTPEINLAWQREYFDKNRHVGIAGGGFATNLTMGQPGRNVALAGIDFLVMLFDKYGIEASYDFEWNKLYLDHFFYFGCNFKF